MTIPNQNRSQSSVRHYYHQGHSHDGEKHERRQGNNQVLPAGEEPAWGSCISISTPKAKSWPAVRIDPKEEPVDQFMQDDGNHGTKDQKKQTWKCDDDSFGNKGEKTGPKLDGPPQEKNSKDQGADRGRYLQEPECTPVVEQVN